MKKAIPIVVVLAAVGTAIWWFGFRGKGDDRSGVAASGTVEATDAQLGFPMSGRLEEVAVKEGDQVPAGALVARLDRSEPEARRRQTEAQIAAAKAMLTEMERGFRSEEVGEGQAAADAARARLEDARSDLSRTERLYQGGAASREAYDKAKVAVEVAEKEAARAEEKLRLLKSGQRKETIEAQRAQVAQAEASLQAVDATLGHMTVVAPFDGLVTVRHREPGEIVAAGSPVVTLTNMEDRWVRIYVREDRVGAVHLGADATISSDTYPGKRYAGRVTFISSEAEFTPKNVQTQEERVRLVYAVKVKVMDDPQYELKPGMPVDVDLELAPAAAGGQP